VPAHAVLALLPYTNLKARGILGDAIRTLAPLAATVPAYDLGRGPLDAMARAVERLAGAAPSGSGRPADGGGEGDARRA
jgi:hypothetical protein